MQKSVTVEEAIHRGKWMIVYLSYLIFFLFLFCTIFFSVEYDSLKFATAGIIFSIASPFLYRYFVITQWKIWAYKNVRNVHQLRQKAFEEGLMYSQDNNAFFEFRSANQKEKLKELDQKFLEDDVFKDDSSLPTEMFIFFSIFKAVSNIIIWCGISFGVYAYLGGNDKKNILIILLILYLLFIQCRYLINRNPQIKLSNKGIQLENQELISWRNIKDEKLIVERNYGKLKIRKKYLTFYANDSYQSILINPLAISFKDLENVLQVYRVRYEKGNQY